MEIYKMRETEKIGGTGFNCDVYSSEGMAKETVGMRVPVAIAEQVDRYAETHELSRTDAMEIFLRTGLEQDGEGDEDGRKQRYTGRLEDFSGEGLPHEQDPQDVRRGLSPEQVITRSLGALGSYAGEFEEEKALTARLPGGLVREMEEWAESQDVALSAGAADLLERGLRADPLPADYSSELKGRSYTLELEPEEAELFRRYRLSNTMTPDEAASQLLSWEHHPVEWGRPDEDPDEREN